MSTTQKVIMWMLAILLAVSVVFAVIFAIKLRKEKKLSAEEILKRYVSTLPIYASNSDAVDAGLKAGDKYRTSADAVSFSVVQ